MKTISILGCGWLGFPLAKHLLGLGYRVKGSVTGASRMVTLKSAGIDACQIMVKHGVSLNEPAFFRSEILVITIPPGRTAYVESRYPGQIMAILEAAKAGSVRKVLFTSSTSVYPEINDTVSETFAGSPEKASGRAILEVERALRNEKAIEHTILRFGGLIDNDRNPSVSLNRKKIKPKGNAPVNLIHRDDCIAIITEVIAQEKWGYIFNACAPLHPTKKEFYSQAAMKQNIPLPEFIDGEDRFKIVDSSYLMKILDYAFKYPDPIKMYSK